VSCNGGAADVSLIARGRDHQNFSAAGFVERILEAALASRRGLRNGGAEVDDIRAGDDRIFDR
jgi:hypothetical protein